ncbi:MAG: hypothetical protein JNN18_06555 [Rubrivivax sp.]|nr:hypothetical protein [Rubrivivax sp.]
MAIKSKFLGDAGWKDLAAKNRLKDNGLAKSLEKLRRTDEDEYDDQARILEEVVRLVAALKKDKSVTAVPAVVKYVGEMQGDAEAALRDVAKARAELDKAMKAKAEAEKAAAKKAEQDDEDDEDVESPELLTTKLKPLLKLVAKGQTMHALLAKSGKQVVVMLSRKPIPPARRKILAEQLGGGSTKYYPGTCSLEAGATTFLLRNEVAGMSKLVKAAVLEQTGLRLNKIKCRGEDGDDHDDDDPGTDAGGDVEEDIADLSRGKAAVPTLPAGVSALVRPAPSPGSGGGRFDDSSIEFTGLAAFGTQMLKVDPSTSIEIDAGETRTLVFILEIEAFEDNLPIPVIGGNESFTQKVTVSWEISADLKGALKITRTKFSLGGPSSGGTNYTVQSVTPAEDEAKGIVSVTAVVVGAGTEWEKSLNVGAEKGKLSGGVDLGKTIQKAGSSVQEMFTIRIKVVNIPAPPEPTGTVEVGKEIMVGVEKDYVVGPFAVDSSTSLDSKSPLSPGDAVHLRATTVEKAVYDLFYSLPQSARDSFVNGKVPGEEVGMGRKIDLHGYASNTGKEKLNFDLSRSRGQAVLAAFRSLGVPAAVFQEVKPHGEWETRDDKGMSPTDVVGHEKESADWRKVVIKMKYAVAVNVP